MNQKYCILDFETRSPVDLKKTGAYEYCLSDQTEVICAAVSLGTRESLVSAPIRLIPLLSQDAFRVFFQKMYEYLQRDITFVAHNAMFEHSIFLKAFDKLKKFYAPMPDKFICTAALARYHGLPGALDGAAIALDLKENKDKVGHKLMLKLSRMRQDYSYYDDNSEFKKLYEYCIHDVLVEREIFLTLPPLPESEREIWLLDQKMNFFGVQTDTDLATKAVKQIKVLKEYADAEVQAISNGAVNSVTQRNAFLELLQAYVPHIENLQKDYLKDRLNDTDNDTAKRLINLRLENSLTSVAKYKSLLNRVTKKGRIHDYLLYHGASTGRWTSSGLQVHNLPRGRPNTDYETLRKRLRCADKKLTMHDLSDLVRTVLIPSDENSLLFCGDFSGIELRVLMWLVDEFRTLDLIRNGDDVYKDLAAYIYNKSVENVTKEEREVGKRAVLGCGYGMGNIKFKKTVDAFGEIAITQELANAAVNAYRSRYKAVVSFWHNINNCCIDAVKSGKKFNYKNRLLIEANKEYLTIQLPSGRKLHYRKPGVERNSSNFHKGLQLTYFSINQVTRKFEKTRSYGGMLTENIVQAIARDVMAHKMLALYQSDFMPLFTVHDEIVTEAFTSRESKKKMLKDFKTIMESPIDWCETLPVKVDEWCGKYYKK